MSDLCKECGHVEDIHIPSLVYESLSPCMHNLSCRCLGYVPEVPPKALRAAVEAINATDEEDVEAIARIAVLAAMPHIPAEYCPWDCDSCHQDCEESKEAACPNCQYRWEEED